MKKQKWYEQTINMLLDLKKEHPTVSLGRHLETIREQCGDMWGVSDATLHDCVEEYCSTIAIDPLEELEDNFFIEEEFIEEL